MRCMIPIKISFLYCTSVSLRIINMYRHASGWPNSTTVSMRKLIIYIIFLSRGFASAQCPAITLLQMFHPQLLLDFKLVPTTTPPNWHVLLGEMQTFQIGQHILDLPRIIVQNESSLWLPFSMSQGGTLSVALLLNGFQLTIPFVIDLNTAQLMDPFTITVGYCTLCMIFDVLLLLKWPNCRLLFSI